MNLQETILSRRSVRRYEDKDISVTVMEELLKAAMAAPSAGNAQPWHFIVVRNKETLTQVSKLNPYAAMAAEAPAGVLVCGDTSLERFDGYWVQDCSAAIQNLLLSAHAQGIGAVWTGIYPVSERVTAFKEQFSLPRTVMPLGFVVLGYPEKQPEPANRFQESRIHQEAW